MKQILVAVVVLMAVSVRAEENLAAKKALAETLMKLMNVPENIEKSFDMARKQMQKQMDQLQATHGGASPEAAAKAEKVWDMVASELKWEKVKDGYIDLYATTLTERDLKAAIAYYKSEDGQSFVRKQPDIMKGGMELNQKMMMRIMPRLQELAAEARKEAPADHSDCVHP